MRRHFIWLSLAVCCAAAGADEIALVGVIGKSAAVLALDGGDPKTVKLGQTWNGITLLAVEHDQATIEYEGHKRVLQRGQHYRGVPPPSSRASVVLASDGRGHFFAEGAVNGVAARFLVDPGASMVVISANDAGRVGVAYTNGGGPRRNT